MKMVFEPETLKDINGMMVNGIRPAKKNMMQIQHCSGTLSCQRQHGHVIVWLSWERQQLVKQ